jgi:hypothetical protein
MISVCEGLHVQYKHFIGTIRFVTDSYLTICIHNGKRKLNDVCIVVYRTDWNQIRLYKESEK